MPLWPLIAPVLRYALANVDVAALYARMSASRARRVPRTRAFVVDALNVPLPKARRAWTPQSLFLFIAAFVRVELAEGSNPRIEWICEPRIVSGYIVRGLPSEEREVLHEMLLEECGEVFETLQANAPQARAPRRAIDADAQPLRLAGDAEAGFVDELRRATELGPRLYTRLLSRVAAEKTRKHDRRIAALLAEALLGGGLSTNECRKLLLDQGLFEQDVDRVLRSM